MWFHQRHIVRAPPAVSLATVDSGGIPLKTAFVLIVAHFTALIGDRGDRVI